MKNDIHILDRIIKCCENTESYLCGIENFKDFMSDKKTIEVCVFNLLQIGEYTTKLSNDFCKKYSNIQYNAMRGLRNRIVHDYSGINLNIVWETLSIDIPNLKIDLIIIKKNI